MFYELFSELKDYRNGYENSYLSSSFFNMVSQTN